MSVARSVADVIKQHVTLEVEGIDRMYLNVYQPKLQHDKGVVGFFRFHRGHTFASSVLMDPISKAFIADIEKFVAAHKVPLLLFQKKQRKDDVALAHLAKFTAKEGVLFVGKAQEKTGVFRTEKRKHPQTGLTYPWIVKTTAMVNHFYFYCVDEDFGPFFIKFCSYFPYNAKLCLNGHEYLKKQLAKEGIAFTALDNGVLSCANPKRMQEIADGLSAEKIDALLRKWLAKLPHPFAAADRQAGYRYDVSILQAEFALTQVLDRPATGRLFFEEVIRDNLHLGRPDQVQLIFSRRVTKRTPGRFRTRVVTEGVTPSLHFDYKHSRIKQYHKESRALRTETTINNTRDFGIGKRLCNLPALRQIGFQANRRLLDVQQLSQDCAVGEEAFARLNQPLLVDGQRASGLRFADTAVQALLCALVIFRLLPRGFSNRELRNHWAPLIGKAPNTITPGQMTYHLRRLRLHGLIERTPKTHRYQVTEQGFRIACFCTRAYRALLRPGLAEALTEPGPEDSKLQRAFATITDIVADMTQEARLAA
jgi:hypothetical protein